MAKNSQLDGLKGIVYLMFLERETQAGTFDEKLVKLGIIQRIASVSQAIAALKKEGLITDLRQEKHERGQPVYRTADASPFFFTFNESKIKVTEEQRKGLRILVKLIANRQEQLAPVDFFLDYAALNTMFTKRIRKLTWQVTLSTYLAFSDFVLKILIVQEYDKKDQKELSKLEKKNVENLKSEIEKIKETKEVNKVFGKLKEIPFEATKVANKQALEELRQLFPEERKLLDFLQFVNFASMRLRGVDPLLQLLSGFMKSLF
jgi:hypothetical protein